MDDNKYLELLAMIIELTKRLEKLEGKSRIASVSFYVDDLKRDTQRILQELKSVV